MASDAGESPLKRRTVWVLAALLVALVALVGYQMGGSSATGAGPASNLVSRRAAADKDAVGAPPPDVRLDALATPVAAPADVARNPFRFGPRAPVVRPGPSGNAAATPGAPVAPPVAPPAQAAGAAPIPLKFIGTVAAPGAGTIAALSDGTFVYHGREGDVIDGRYRIVKIGVESIVMEHVDGRGRQTIRLTG